MSNTRIAFAGARPLGAVALELLADACERTGGHLVAVHTDEPGSRFWWSSDAEEEVWQVAHRLRIPCVDPGELSAVGHDVLISVLCSTIFSAELLALAPVNVNLHAAPLPEYRGCHAYAHAILAGEAEFGTSLHVMTPGVDAGPIIEVARFPIRDTDTAGSLYERTMRHSAALLRCWIPRVVAGAFASEPQSEVARRRRVSPRYFDLRSLEPYMTEPDAPLTPEERARWRRALTFPPRFTPPAWLERGPVAD